MTKKHQQESVDITHNNQNVRISKSNHILASNRRNKLKRNGIVQKEIICSNSIIVDKPNPILSMNQSTCFETWSVVTYPVLDKNNKVEYKYHVIICANWQNKYQYIALRLTSKMSRFGETRIPIRKDSKYFKAMGLTKESVILVDSEDTIIQDKIKEYKGKCPPSLISKIKEVLRVLWLQKLSLL